MRLETFVSRKNVQKVGIVQISGNSSRLSCDVKSNGKRSSPAGCSTVQVAGKGLKRACTTCVCVEKVEA